jgi:hypothetical protein
MLYPFLNCYKICHHIANTAGRKKLPKRTFFTVTFNMHSMCPEGLAIFQTFWHLHKLRKVLPLILQRCLTLLLKPEPKLSFYLLSLAMDQTTRHIALAYRHAICLVIGNWHSSSNFIQFHCHRNSFGLYPFIIFFNCGQSQIVV